MKKLKFLLRTASLCMAFILMGTNTVSAKTPKVKKIKFSNVSSKKTMYRGTSKKFTVKITATDESKKTLKFRYTKGKKSVSYFKKGKKGMKLKNKKGKADFQGKRNCYYTIYVKDKCGNEKIKKVKL